MTLQELKDAIRTEHPLYKCAIEKIQEQAFKCDGDTWVDFTEWELPPAVHHRLVEDGYAISYNKHLDFCYRVSGWAGVEGFNG